MARKTVRPVDTRKAEVVQVIRTTSAVGRGLDESDPMREVVSYWDFDGNKLATFDPFPDAVSPDDNEVKPFEA